MQNFEVFGLGQFMLRQKLYLYCNIALITAALISGLSFVAQKLGMNYVGPFTFNTLRCFIGCISLLPVMFLFDKFSVKKRYSNRELINGGVLAGIILFTAFSINQYCMIYADAGKAGFITSLYIIFVPVIAVFLKHKLGLNVKISIAFALAGLYLLCAKSFMQFEVWDIFLLISAFFFALHIITVNYYSKKTDVIKFSAFQFFIAGIISLPLMFIFEKPLLETILEGWKPILFIGVVVTGVAYTLQIFGHKATKPVLATLILSSEAVFAVIGGMLILGETLTFKEIIGCTLMFAAIIVSQISYKTKGDLYMKNRISDKTFDEERSLYNLQNTEVVNCKFEGPADGESVLKESGKVDIKECSFSLRYPLWHSTNFSLKNSSMDEKTRAPLWYSGNGTIENCKIEGVKCLRECNDIIINDCSIASPEFGWKCKNLKITNSSIDAVYFLFESENVEIVNLNMTGKYSFQYMKNLSIKNSSLDTKDAFWHSKDVVVENSVVKGEYLGWFSENLTFVNCKIIGTQPLCYCKNLRLINCTMENTDLSFEYSEVNADIIGNIVSVKNPKSGIITADSVGEVIMEDAVMNCTGKVNIRKNLSLT